MQNTEETIMKYAVDANLIRLESTNSDKKFREEYPEFFISRDFYASRHNGAQLSANLEALDAILL